MSKTLRLDMAQGILLSGPSDNWVLLALHFQQCCFCCGSGRERRKEVSKDEESYRARGRPRGLRGGEVAGELQ